MYQEIIGFMAMSHISKQLVNIFLDHINFLKEAELIPAYKKQIRIHLNPKLCTECFANKSKTLTMLCENCNLKVHGNMIPSQDCRVSWWT